MELQTRHKARGIEVIGLNLESDAPAVRDFAKAYDINYPVLLTRDKGIALLQALGNPKAGLPYTVVINRKGEIVASKLGAMNQAELEAASAPALKLTILAASTHGLLLAIMLSMPWSLPT